MGRMAQFKNPSNKSNHHKSPRSPDDTDHLPRNFGLPHKHTALLSQRIIFFFYSNTNKK
uniref:Uncharacterized protein n=1 Tax=Anguilla anguilla TaxID=7936 RepID=A0A0E9WU90_ANGAN